MRWRHALRALADLRARAVVHPGPGIGVGAAPDEPFETCAAAPQTVGLGPHASGFREDRTRIDLRARPRQGRLGDCWVMAGLLAIHSAAPELIDELVGVSTDVRTGVSTGRVRLFERQGGRLAPASRRLQRIEVEVDRMMPVDSAGAWVYATQSGRGAAAGPGWAGIVEKALAQRLAGSYRFLARGLGRYGLQALTGARVRTHLLLPSSRRLARWTADGHAVLASTHPLSFLVRTSQGRVPTSHVMAVVGADRRTGHVHLRNPWRPDDLLVIDRRSFRRAFVSVDRTARPLRRS
ncbi:C2 family cysteine protease [Brachybacterium sp. JHP9]|uniref:C2 family cysteine protease n=1 Tax=Brachybacterium equifaecis TaxID=2910770 RepID=A0ABT0R1N0_9MICO|nr:C2 family cysteine protease [Brachybacterium equifaecis]MCL6423806.1 C2 family cysteine protease [Brachybacterium equifaecis]